MQKNIKSKIIKITCDIIDDMLLKEECMFGCCNVLGAGLIVNPCACIFGAVCVGGGWCVCVHVCVLTGGGVRDWV